MQFPASPAVGTDFTYTVPGDSRVEIVTVMCELTTDATVGNRGVSLRFRNWNARRFLVAGTAAVIAESTTQAFCWQSAAGPGVWAVDDAALAGMPSVMLLPQCTATIHVTNMQAGDQVSEVALLLDVYPPRAADAAEVANPLLGALQELNVAGIAEDVEALRLALVEHRGAVLDSVAESRRARFDREALAQRAIANGL